MDKKVDYWVMDGRAEQNIDDAMVLSCEPCYKSARKSINNFGADSCIVRVTDTEQDLLWCLLWGEPPKTEPS